MAGNTRTQMAGRQSLGTNLEKHALAMFESPHILLTPQGHGRRICKKPNGKQNLLASIEEDKPSSNGEEGQEELPGDWHEEGAQESSGDRGLSQRTRRLNDRQGEKADDKEQQVLEVIQRPSVCLQGSEGVDRREGGLQPRYGRGG